MCQLFLLKEGAKENVYVSHNVSGSEIVICVKHDWSCDFVRAKKFGAACY